VGKRRAGIVLSEHTDEGGATVKCLVSKRLPASTSAVPEMKVTGVDSDAAREDCDHDSHDPEEENFKLARGRHSSVLAEHSLQRKRKPSVRKTTVAGMARFGCAT
jgi:hypothetical protein